jgi:hypothetical protein
VFPGRAARRGQPYGSAERALVVEEVAAMNCGLTHGERRAVLTAAHGLPRRADPGGALRVLGKRDLVHPRDVIAFVYRDQAAAEAWAASNVAHYGHPSLGLTPVDGGVLGVLDLRGVLECHGVAVTDPAEPDDWLPAPVPPARSGS